MPDELHTPRLDLVPATASLLRAELAGELAIHARSHVPEGWPPDLFDADALRFMLGWAEAHPDDVRWGAYYIALREGPGDRTLVGTGGFKGPPSADGRVEIGYSILTAYQRRGFAAEAVGGWIAIAAADPRVTEVIAHTFPSNEASIGVLLRSGFTLEPGGTDPDDPGSVRYVLPVNRPAGPTRSLDR